MKKYSTIYYLLFVLIVMGAFASMAQNAYGLRICGVACLGFALTFLHEIFFTTRAADDPLFPSWIVYGELISLTVIALVFLLKNFSLDFPFSSLILILTLTVLFSLLSYQALLQIQMARLKHAKLVTVLALYYGAVIVFILSVLTGIMLPDASNLLAILAMTFTAGFIVFALVARRLSIDGETISVWHYFRQLKNKSAILLITCLLIYSYNLLYVAGTLPPLYHGTLPNGYQHLVERSIKSNDQKKLREFMERYEAFLQRHAKN